MAKSPGRQGSQNRKGQLQLHAIELSFEVDGSSCNEGGSFRITLRTGTMNESPHVLACERC